MGQAVKCQLSSYLGMIGKKNCMHVLNINIIIIIIMKHMMRQCQVIHMKLAAALII